MFLASHRDLKNSEITEIVITRKIIEVQRKKTSFSHEICSELRTGTEFDVGFLFVFEQSF